LGVDSWKGKIFAQLTELVLDGCRLYIEEFDSRLKILIFRL
jgi:hypothetical protein